MENNRFDIEIITTTVKKWNLSIIIIFILLLIISVFSISYNFYILFLVWAVIAGGFLLYDFKRSRSIVTLATTLLFNDDGFSIVTNDNNFNLQLKKEFVTNIKFNKENNHIIIFQDDAILYDFCVTTKSLNELYDIFNSFGYKCELSSFI